MTRVVRALALAVLSLGAGRADAQQTFRAEGVEIQIPAGFSAPERFTPTGPVPRTPAQILAAALGGDTTRLHEPLDLTDAENTQLSSVLFGDQKLINATTTSYRATTPEGGLLIIRIRADSTLDSSSRRNREGEAMDGGIGSFVMGYPMGVSDFEAVRNSGTHGETDDLSVYDAELVRGEGEQLQRGAVRQYITLRGRFRTVMLLLFVPGGGDPRLDPATATFFGNPIVGTKAPASLSRDP